MTAKTPQIAIFIKVKVRAPIMTCSPNADIEVDVGIPRGCRPGLGYDLLLVSYSNLLLLKSGKQVEDYPTLPAPA
jgi:hypothetical protein